MDGNSKNTKIPFYCKTLMESFGIEIKKPFPPSSFLKNKYYIANFALPYTEESSCCCYGGNIEGAKIIPDSILMENNEFYPFSEYKRKTGLSGFVCDVIQFLNSPPTENCRWSYAEDKDDFLWRWTLWPFSDKTSEVCFSYRKKIDLIVNQRLDKKERIEEIASFNGMEIDLTMFFDDLPSISSLLFGSMHKEKTIGYGFSFLDIDFDKICDEICDNEDWLNPIQELLFINLLCNYVK